MSLVVDTYGIAVRARTRRHWKCRCKVRCQRRFRCAARGHVGKRSTPWCCGAHPDEFCDACWARLSVSP